MNSLFAYIDTVSVRVVRRATGYFSLSIVASLLVLTALFAWAFVLWVPDNSLVVVARIVVFALLIGGAVAVIFKKPKDAVPFIEQQAPAFAGSLRTWRDAMLRGEDSAVLGLLGRQTARVAEDHSQDVLVPKYTVILPFAISMLVAAALVGLVVTGNNPWQLAAKRLWTGDLFTATAPRIVVSPGDTVIPKGRNVVIEAHAFGFDVQQMQVHAMFANAPDWEQASMTRLDDDKYGFVFVGVNEEVEYYVGAKGLNSQRHVIRVADLPRVTDVSLAYQYPSWTGIKPSEELDGDISAVTGTAVQLTATTDKPITDPLIVVNDVITPGNGEGMTARGGFEVTQAGSWYVAVRHEGTLAQISDTYLINLVEDRPPQVAFTWPGSDRQATSIEEVSFRFEATDDFVLEGLTMNYSVNGGEWVEVALDREDPRHELYLEDITVAEPDGRTLVPGDMISFYAEARDHTQNSKTALYFVDVRPFDRIYRESQSNGGGGGDQGFEIAQRQREIVTATWNLLNKSDGGEAGQTLADQSETLALLERTLLEQVGTLIARADARRLTQDEEIDEFTAQLTEAMTHMEPAAEMLESQALRDAIVPEQKALQHLLAAEATMTDIDVSMSQGQGRGASGRSLSELVDLEMDQERNRYETQQNPSSSEEESEDDSDWRELEELARRQEQLGQDNNSQSEQQSLASRWQQERLKREIEQLQEQLERQRQRQQGRGTQSQALENAISDLNEARDWIERALSENQSQSESQGQSGGSQSQSGNSSQQAASAMRNAAQQLRNNERSNLDERLARTGRQVDNLLNDQRLAVERLTEVQQESLEAARRGEGNPFRNFAMEPFVDRKRRMQEDLADVTQDINTVSDALADRDPRAQKMLTRAVQELQEENIDERLGASADAFAIGRPLFAMDNETTVERALERLGRRIGQAQGEISGNSDNPAANGSPLAQVRELRRALAEARAEASAQEGQGGQGQGQENGDPSNGAGGNLARGGPYRGGPNGGTNVEYDRGKLNSLMRETENLEYRVNEQLGQGSTPDTTQDRLDYLARGTDAENDVALASLLKDRLDLIEAALLSVESVPIRAQKPRDIARDSDVAAEYFRELSAAQHTP
jgi:hypothetical protein